MFFPSRNGPSSRRRPAALDRQVTPGPYCRASRVYSVLSNHRFKCVYRMYTSLNIYSRTSLQTQPSSSRIVRTVFLASSTVHPASRARHATLHHPPAWQGHTSRWVPPSQPQLTRRLWRFAHPSPWYSALQSVLDVSLLARPGLTYPSRISDVRSSRHRLGTLSSPLWLPSDIGHWDHFSLIPD